MRRAAAAAITALVLSGAHAQETRGVPTSLFGTYVRGHEILVYPFYEYTKTTAFEYKPSELGFPGEADFLGRTDEHELLVFLGYGITDRLAVELEVAFFAKTSFEKAPDDPSAVPPSLEESGLGDVDMQVRWLWNEEAEHRLKLFSFFELTPPFQKNKTLIGTGDWEASLGFGVDRGYAWGSISGRVSAAWDGADSKLDLGEYAFQYVRRVTPRWRLVGAVEGESDEISVIGEAQWSFASFAYLKLNCGFGVTEKAPDLAPEVGVLFHF